jgi:hypothetical protein
MIVQLAALSLAAAAPATPRCTLPGGTAWREVRSPHFVIDAAGWDKDARALAAPFEDLYAAVVAALIAEPVEIPAKVRVVLVPDLGDLRAYTYSRYVNGEFWVTPQGEPTILMSTDQVNDLPYVIAHELTHYVSSFLFTRQPRWFAEGLAQFIESVAKKDRDGKRWAGGNPSNGLFAGNAQLARAESLLSGYGDYVSAFVLYRLLWNEHSEQLSDYQRRLMDGEDPKDAWREAFPQWDFTGGKVRNLDNDLHDHQNKGRGVRWEVKARPGDYAVTSDAASLADVHLVLLGFRLLMTNQRVQDRVSLETMEEAVREDPGNPLATAELARLQKEDVLGAVRAVTEARPADPRGWYLRGIHATDPSEKESSLRRAVELWPEGALANAALATHLATSQRARAALPFANRAIELAPWHPAAVSSLATVALELGQCKQARVLQVRALEAAKSERVGAAGADVPLLTRQLADIDKRCAAAVPHQAPPPP